MPKVSVIIPCYNHGVYIEEAIDSLLSQTFEDFEIIVINDDSDDVNTLVVLNNLNRPKTKIFHTSRKGVSAARNYGISQSVGEFIFPLDADDWVDSRFLSLAVPLLEQNEQLEIIGSGVQYFGDLNAKEFLPDYHPKQHLLQNLFFNTSVFRKASFEKINGYDEAFINGWEDWDMFLRLVNHPTQVHILKDYLLHYRIKKESRNADLMKEKKQRSEQQLFVKHLNKYMEHFPEPIQALRDNAYMSEEIKNFEKYKAELSGSLSYRIGHLTLSPFKWFSKRIKASK